MPFRSAILLVLVLLLIVCPAHAEKRVALVIGNALYKNAATLLNPRNDATDVSEALKRLGFETIVGLDLNKDGMEEKSIAFARAARDADVALVYYSGHAMQFGGINYLMPVDAALHDEADLRRLTRVDEIVADLKQAKNLRILVLDACRDNPLADELSRSMEASRGLTVDRGLARIIPPSGMVISYATQAGRTAADGRERNSPYTMAFLKNIEATEEIGTIFRHITKDVYSATEGKQLPELSLSLVSDFYLNGRPKADSTLPAIQSTSSSEDEVLWNLVKDSHTPDLFEEFLAKFPASKHVPDARNRFIELSKQQTNVASKGDSIVSAKSNTEGSTTTFLPVSQGEIDLMRTKLRDHWSPDEAIFERPDQYVVLVRVQLGRDRRLAAPPQVVSTGSGPLYQATAEAAKRAILLSQPFDMLSLSTYDTWKDMEISFNPRELRNRADSSNAQTTVVAKGDRAQPNLVGTAGAGLHLAPDTQVAVIAPPSSPPRNPCAGATMTVSLSPTCPLTAAEERALKPKDAFKECEKCPEMVMVPAGSFTMGSPANEAERSAEESPQHRVTFSKPFAVGRFSVTFDEWDACVADGGCNNYKPDDAGWGRGRRPVINVSWDDANAYVTWLSRKTGKPYRLLSEAEREYVTRAGTTTPFWWGVSISTNQANYNGNFTYGSGAKGDYRQKTVAVDSFQPNPWGLYQVHGNVYDWVEDCYHDTYNGAPSDGSAWTSGECKYRVLRGGSWDYKPRNLRAANRYRGATDNRSNVNGVRLGRTLTP
jgi:formylglycine-generating enzyme required for sulfatase activity